MLGNHAMPYKSVNTQIHPVERVNGGKDVLWVEGSLVSAV